MRNLFIRGITNAIAIAVTAYIIPGITVTDNLVPLLIVGIIIAIMNAVLKPILMLLTCPAVLLTLGLFVLVINGLVLWVSASLSGGALVVDGFWAAFFGGIVMAIVNMILEGIIGKNDKTVVKVQKR
jgi:putative membrane protein